MDTVRGLMEEEDLEGWERVRHVQDLNPGDLVWIIMPGKWNWSYLVLVLRTRRTQHDCALLYKGVYSQETMINIFSRSENFMAFSILFKDTGASFWRLNPEPTQSLP